jgi:hypothetical protein
LLGYNKNITEVLQATKGEVTAKGIPTSYNIAAQLRLALSLTLTNFSK